MKASPLSFAGRVILYDGRSAVQVEIGLITTIGAVFFVVFTYISFFAIEVSLWSVLLLSATDIAVVPELSRIRINVKVQAIFNMVNFETHLI